MWKEQNTPKTHIALDCDRKRLERVLVLGATLGWVNKLKRRIREIRGLYGHVVVGEDMLGRLRPEKHMLRRMLPVTQDAHDAQANLPLSFLCSSCH